ncbi:MAG: hypothetical protein NC038_02455 [Paludibacter sp.]|nr:hypothetical protein [Bacteroidales bacterium]MCM1068941.1 hypothetical protein [Prevotella sp.]MCM1353604.1 hypothetical protein [Bacteroides sp.]MCM1442047.1 hypothetical protein [Muribaculum sp.]MCM1481497.1 hypothetical protein [Paludibacter sp.]
MLAVIINPKSGKKAYRQQRLYLFKLLKARHLPFTYKVTKYVGHAIELARELVEKGYDELLVLGGDGTLSEVINGIMSSRVDNKSSIRFGLMPRGTGNDWGRYWGLTNDYKRALDVFFNTGKPQPIDVGCLTYQRNGDLYKHYFVNSVGFGVDARTVARAHVMKYYVGSHRLLYFFALLSAVFTHRSQKVELLTEKGSLLSAPMFTMNIGNGPFSGGGIRQNPDADPCDGIFHAMFVRRPTFRIVCSALPKVFNGGLKDIDFIDFFTARKVILRTQQYMVFEADGILVDACGPYEVEVFPHALQMIVP